ncbi:MAG TPA: paraquat-inducible protein A [Mucilaginibacter sp.]|nr:paraquat-inducible protein A [Mucilaginibacter sp.]
MISLKNLKILLIAGLCIVLAGEAFFGYEVHVLSGKQEEIKRDYSTLNNVTFGLLSINEWRDKITVAVTKRLRNFDLTKEQEKDLQVEIEQILHSLIKKAVAMINKPQKSIGGKLKKLAFNALVDEDKIQAQVPAFARQIIEKIEKPSSKKRLADLVHSKLSQLEQDTYDSTRRVNELVINKLLTKYHATDKDDFNKKAKSSFHIIKYNTYVCSFAMLGCVLAILALWWFLWKRSDIFPTLYILSIISALILLLVGLTTTMIEVDARIRTLNFMLMGEHVSFENQVLFFQSKSIVDVVLILLKTGKIDAIIVGSLIMCFSVLFPIMKLISTGLYVLDKKKWGENKFVYYFAFKSGKWSMADVMVIAILMAYIGFNGIIESSLSNLNIHNNTLTSITTNNTSLQPGYVVFVVFVIYGLILSEILKRAWRSDTGKRTGTA